MTRESVSDEAVTVPPPAITVTSEFMAPEQLQSPIAAAFGVELAEAIHGAGSRRAFLVVHQGYGPSVIELHDGDAVTFGRASTSTVTIDDPRVSRNHARVFRQGPLLLCEDLGSRNGTRVNGASQRDQRRIVVSGDVIRVGVCEAYVAAAVAPGPGEEAGSIGVVVADPKMRDVFALAKQLAGGETSVLVQGEAGVGKKIVAQQIHRWSARSEGPFVELDCEGVDDASIEGALFGYEGGALGHLEAARGGTLLLHGVGGLSARAQAKLMDALGAGTFVRTNGTRGTREVPIDARVLGATHRDLPAEVAAKRFREDLYYALSAFTLRVPPLRERSVEIDLFAHLFVQAFAAEAGGVGGALTEDASGSLGKYDWPGNVRELREAMQQAVGAAEGGEYIDVTCLPEPVRRRGSVKAMRI
jgi:two-component system response regulator AtoC